MIRVMVGVTVVKKTGEKRDPTANEVMVKEIVEERKKWTTRSTIFLSAVVRAMVVVVRAAAHWVV